MLPFSELKYAGWGICVVMWVEYEEGGHLHLQEGVTVASSTPYMPQT